MPERTKLLRFALSLFAVSDAFSPLEGGTVGIFSSLAFCVTFGKRKNQSTPTDDIAIKAIKKASLNPSKSANNELIPYTKSVPRVTGTVWGDSYDRYHL